jgi:hypothetical protein
MAIGLRAEQTDVEGDSRSLGQVNTQNYFELFPNISTTNQVNTATHWHWVTVDPLKDLAKSWDYLIILLNDNKYRKP